MNLTHMKDGPAKLVATREVKSIINDLEQMIHTAVRNDKITPEVQELLDYFIEFQMDKRGMKPYEGVPHEWKRDLGRFKDLVIPE